MHVVQNPEECIKDLITAYKNTGSKLDRFIKKSKIGSMWDYKVPKKDKVKKMHLGVHYDNFSWLGISNKIW